MSSSSPDNWSLRRSLAFLAATFAIVFGAMLPPAVAASPAMGAPVVLCSGGKAFVAFDADGHPKPVPDHELASLQCAGALLSGMAAVAPPPAPVPPAPVVQPVQIRPVAVLKGAAPVLPAPRPPSTAPPLS